MTTSHVDFDSTKPSVTSSPATYGADDVTNLKALRDLIIQGLVPGFVMSRTQGTGPDVQRPQFVTWNNSTLNVGFRWNITWTGQNPTTIQEEWQNDGVPNWISVGSAVVLTFDGSNNVTASTNAGGFVMMLFEFWGKLGKVISDFAAHIIATGTAVHGLGTMSTQAASAVAITGGAANNMALGASTAADVDSTRVRENFHDYGAIAAAGTVTLELDKYAAFAFTPSSTTSDTITIAFSGSPASGKYQSWQLEIINGRRSADGKITWNAAFKWIGGSGTRPLDTVLEIAGRNLFALSNRDGGSRLEVTHLGKGG